MDATDCAVVAVVGGLVQSRETEQAALGQTIARINQRYQAAILVDFYVTLGDRFQGYLRDPRVIPDIVQDLREQLPRTRIRLAVSNGERAASRTNRDGVVFAGFADDDVILGGIAELLAYHWTHLEDSQREILTALRDCDVARKDIAARLRISPQALSNRAQSAGWREYSGGLAAWRKLLGRCSPA